MDQLSQETFDRLVKIDPSSLTSEEIAFLRARRTYLTQDQRRIFISILEEKTRHQELEDLTNAQLIDILKDRKVNLPEKINKENLVQAVEESE